MDRCESYNGNGGPLGSEVTAALYRNKVMIDAVNYIYGLAGRDFTVENVFDIFAELEDAVKDEKAPRVYLGGNSSFLSTAGPAMYQHSMIVNAMGKNVAEDLTDTYWAEVSYEQVLAWDPEYIILAADAKYTVDDVLNDANLQGCTAVKEKRVYQLPRDIECWDSPVPGSILGNLWLASILHPEAFSVETYEESVTEFYETFYGFTP